MFLYNLFLLLQFRGGGVVGGVRKSASVTSQNLYIFSPSTLYNLESEQSCETLSTDRTAAQDEQLPDYLQDVQQEAVFKVENWKTDFDHNFDSDEEILLNTLKLGNIIKQYLPTTEKLLIEQSLGIFIERWIDR